MLKTTSLTVQSQSTLQDTQNVLQLLYAAWHRSKVTGFPITNSKANTAEELHVQNLPTRL